MNVKVSDTWDENQEYVKDSFKMVAVESNNPWKEKESEATKIAPVFHTNGFTWSADKLSDQLYISYRTKVIKQAERYLNSVVLGADNFNSQYRDVPYQFVSGKGKADGENKKEEKKPEEKPKEDPKKPEENLKRNLRNQKINLRKILRNQKINLRKILRNQKINLRKILRNQRKNLR